MRGVELGAILEKTFRAGVLLDGLDGCVGTEFGRGKRRADPL